MAASRRSRTCGRTGSTRPSTCSARRRSQNKRPTATPSAARTPCAPRTFERLTKRLIDNAGLVRVAIASHNLRSISHAAAYAGARNVGNDMLEFQILRGLGDDTQAPIAATGRRVRCYCPVGDLVAGMAYLVRRLLENTANDSFLAAAASGTNTAELLEAP